jgi:hypothetical protein
MYSKGTPRESFYFSHRFPLRAMATFAVKTSEPPFDTANSKRTLLFLCAPWVLLWQSVLVSALFALD